MKRLAAILLIVLTVILAACAAPAASGAADPQDLVEAAGTVQEMHGSLIRITMTDGSAFDLSFGEHVTWADGLEKTIVLGSKVRCMVKPEPTLTTPNRGDVYKVLENAKP